MATTVSILQLPLWLMLTIGSSTLTTCGSHGTAGPGTGSPSEPSAIPARATVSASEKSLPPAYQLRFDGLQLVVDANGVVQGSSAGDVVLSVSSAQGQAGEEWRIFDDSQRCCQSYSFPEIDSLYKSGAAVSTGSISSLKETSISWSQFGLLNKTLPSSRILVVKHTGTGGLCAYELFDVLFPGPSAN